MSPSRGPFILPFPFLNPSSTFANCRNHSPRHALRPRPPARFLNSNHKTTQNTPPLSFQKPNSTLPQINSSPTTAEPKTIISTTTNTNTNTTTTINPTSFNSYQSSPRPSTTQLHYARLFFTQHAPTFLFSSPHFRTLPRSPAPEVAFFGRSNVGKSSLLNALLQRSGVRLARVSSKPGRTRMMNAFGVGGEGGGVKAGVRAGDGPAAGAGGEGMAAVADGRWVGRGGLVVLDMPGYGWASQEEWGVEIGKYLAGRKQLRRVFLLIDALHGAKQTDAAFLRQLHLLGVPFQIVLSKVDRIVWPRAGRPPTEATLVQRQAALDRVVDEVRALVQQTTGAGTAGVDVLACSAERFMPGRRGVPGGLLGVDGLRWAVLAAAGLECDEHGKRRVVDVEMVDDEAGDGEGEDDECVVQTERLKHGHAHKPGVNLAELR